jgi:hypothetical protein
VSCSGALPTTHLPPPRRVTTCGALPTPAPHTPPPPGSVQTYGALPTPAPHTLPPPQGVGTYGALPTPAPHTPPPPGSVTTYGALPTPAPHTPPPPQGVGTYGALPTASAHSAATPTRVLSHGALATTSTRRCRRPGVWDSRRVPIPTLHGDAPSGAPRTTASTAILELWWSIDGTKHPASGTSPTRSPRSTEASHARSRRGLGMPGWRRGAAACRDGAAAACRDGAGGWRRGAAAACRDGAASGAGNGSGCTGPPPVFHPRARLVRCLIGLAGRSARHA